jgi:hypothetical protein
MKSKNYLFSRFLWLQEEVKKVKKIRLLDWPDIGLNQYLVHP